MSKEILSDGKGSAGKSAEAGDACADFRREFGDGVLQILLTDRTTGRNIYWACDSYKKRGEGYAFKDEITIARLFPEGAGAVVRPRAKKTRTEQSKRAKNKAEVFTPTWICNAQNNLVDNAWFGEENVFNEPCDKTGRTWKRREGKIEFPEGKTWRDYVKDLRLEITCGEAPYLANRYDATTGEPVEVKERIGLLDRKLRVVSENVEGSEEWLAWGRLALCSTYGFEWQGDNLFLARMNVFLTFFDHYRAKFGEHAYRMIRSRVAKNVAEIISWNLWQMDGLKYGLPGYEPQEEGKGTQLKLFDAGQEKEEGKEFKRFCRVKDYFERLVEKPKGRAKGAKAKMDGQGAKGRDSSEGEPVLKAKIITAKEPDMKAFVKEAVVTEFRKLLNTK